MDDDETDTLGVFGTWEAAVEAARWIVDRSLDQSYRPGISAAEWYDHYTSFGEDPFITPEPPGEHFSAWNYARKRCEDRCAPGA
ncbi:MAG: hypothetical protein GC162_09215 [Planctomycetes bacterium]|nr:hypothetical protein [Planctomycetota bacterium]